MATTSKRAEKLRVTLREMERAMLRISRRGGVRNKKIRRLTKDEEVSNRTHCKGKSGKVGRSCGQRRSREVGKKDDAMEVEKRLQKRWVDNAKEVIGPPSGQRRRL